MKSRLSHCTIASVAVICTAVGLAAGAAQNAVIPPPIFPTTDPVINKIVVENEYGFSLRRYVPALDFKPVARASAKYDTPEATTIALLSAMSAGDVEWFRGQWDSESIRLMEERDKQQGHDAAFWIGMWDRTLKDRRIAITTRIQTGGYVVVVYELSPVNGSAADPLQLETPLKQVGARWVATQELSSDPVLLYWKTPNVRAHRVIRGVQP